MLLDGVRLLPYAATRLTLAYGEHSPTNATWQFLSSQLRGTLVSTPLAPLGRWMDLRAAWLAVGYGCWVARRALQWLTVTTLVAMAGVSVVLAADLSRSVAVLSPLMLFRCFAFVRRWRVNAPRTLLALGLANLRIPAAHMTHTHIDPINPLPIELFRLFRPV